MSSQNRYAMVPRVPGWGLILCLGLGIGGTGIASETSFPGAGESRVSDDFRVHTGWQPADVEDAFTASTQPQGLSLEPMGDRTRIDSRLIAVDLEEVSPFLAVGVRWTVDQPLGAGVRLSLRGSPDGLQWREWRAVEDHGHEAAGERQSVEGERWQDHYGALTYLAADTRYVQYRLELQRGVLGQAPIARAVDLHFISPGKTPESRRGETRPSEDHRPALTVEPGSQDVTLPDYVPRSTWGNLSNRANRVPINVSHLVVHHSDTPNNASDWEAVVRSIHRFHTGTRGWADIGYHWLVSPEGTLYQGRAHMPSGNPDVQGAHAPGANSFSMAVNYLGSFTHAEPSHAAHDTAAETLAWKADEQGIPVGRVQGHRDWTATECPGESLYGLLPVEVRPRVADFLEGDDGQPEPIEGLWHRAAAVNGNPWYFGSESNAQRGLANDGEHAYVVSRHSEEYGPHVMVHDLADGSLRSGAAMTLDTSGISGGTLALNGIDTGADGGIFAANLAVPMSEEAFRVYYWTDRAASPVSVVEFSGSAPHRIGDNIAVSGSMAEGDARIWAPAADAPVVYRWSMSHGQFNQWPEVIQLSDDAEGFTPSVAPLENGRFLWNARDAHMRLYDLDGSVMGTVPGHTVAQDSHAVDYLGRDGEDLWVATYQFGPENENARIVRVPESDPGAAGTLSQTRSLAEHVNPNATGDVSVAMSDDEELQVHVLATNNGLGAYQVNGIEVMDGTEPGSFSRQPEAGSSMPAVDFSVEGPAGGKLEIRRPGTVSGPQIRQER